MKKQEIIDNKKYEIIDSFHQDTVHDLSFNLYGNRLATCSSDRKVKIYNKVNDKWILNSEFIAHDGPIWKVKWAHPDFGNILATCSYDKSVNIWEERKPNIISHLFKNNTNPNLNIDEQSPIINSNPQFSLLQQQQQQLQQQLQLQSNWISKIKLFDIKESVEDIKFAPKNLGLMLAAASCEGSIRIYVAPDIMNLASWRQEYEFEASSWGINSISWNKNPFDPPMIVVASKDKSTSFHNNNNLSENSLNQDSYQDMDIKTTNKQIYHSVSSNLNLLGNVQQQQQQQQQLQNTFLSIYYFLNNKWSQLSILNYPQGLFQDSNEQNLGHQGAVYDVSWAQLNGRSYDLLASCGKDGIKVWQLKYNDVEKQLIVKKMYQLKDESDRQLQVWRISWNLMATVLAASDEKNQVKLWKRFGDKFQNIVTLKQDEIENQQD